MLDEEDVRQLRVRLLEQLAVVMWCGVMWALLTEFIYGFSHLAATLAAAACAFAR